MTGPPRRTLHWSGDRTRVQRGIITRLSDELLRRSHWSNNHHQTVRLAKLVIECPYPAFMFEQLIQLADRRAGVLSTMSESLHATLKSVRELTWGHMLYNLRCPLFLQVRLVLAYMIELEAARRQVHDWPLGTFKLAYEQIGFVLVAMADGCDAQPIGQVVAETFHSVGTSYTEIGESYR